jgi:hypothetical protein
MKTFKQLLDSLDRKQYVDEDIVDSIVPCEFQELEFFKLSRYVTNEELSKEYETKGLVPISPYALALYDEKYPKKMDEMGYVGTSWKNSSGEWCFAAFNHWFDGRFVRVYRYDRDWYDSWWFAGLRKTSDIEPKPSLEPMSLETAIKICKENGLKVIKEI